MLNLVKSAIQIEKQTASIAEQNEEELIDGTTRKIQNLAGDIEIDVVGKKKFSFCFFIFC